MTDERFEFSIVMDDKKPVNRYDFNEQLKKLKYNKAMLGTDMLRCPFCNHDFKVDKNQFSRQEGKHILQTCPSCESVLKIYRSTK